MPQRITETTGHVRSIIGPRTIAAVLLRALAVMLSFVHHARSQHSRTAT